MQIRVMNTEDYDRVHALWMSCSGLGLNDLDDSREGIERYLRRNPDTCFVAEEGSELTGVILAGHDGRRGYIYHTAVRDDRRGQGTGRALAEAAIEALKACGINKAALVAFAHNEAGNRFWEKMGFSAREDLVYRNRALAEIKRMDT